MTKQEMYYAIVKPLHTQFPRVIGAFRDLIHQNKISPEMMIDYLDLWSRSVEKQLKGGEGQFGSEDVVIYVNMLSLQLVRAGVFTKEEWMVCLSNMISAYANLVENGQSATALGPERQIAEHASAPPAHTLSPGAIEMFDGRRLSPKEAEFQAWASERFDVGAWLRKLKLRW